MANSCSTKKAESASLPSEDSSEKTLRTTHCKPKFFSLFNLLLAALAFSLALYATSRTLQLQDQKQTWDIAMKAMNQVQTEQRNKLDEMQQAITKAQASMQESMSTLNKQIHQSLNQTAFQKQDWVLLKARYYLELAQINAHWSGDQQTTSALLQAADDILKVISDQKIYSVRQAIAQELSQIKAIPIIDIAGIMSQLDAAQTAISELPVKNSLNQFTSNTESSTSVKSTGSSWRDKWQDSLRILEKLVVIRHYEGDIQPQLSPLHQALVRESIRMNLQQAQWAVFQNNPVIYQQSLKLALTNINRTFEPTAPATQALIKTLQNLQQINLMPMKPAIEKSLPLLNTFIESKTKSAVQPSTATEEDN